MANGNVEIQVGQSIVKWAAGIFAFLCVAYFTWLGNAVANIRVDVAVFKTKIEKLEGDYHQIDKRVDSFSDRISNNEHRIERHQGISNENHPVNP